MNTVPIFDFTSPARSGAWAPVDDVVMGGVSASAFDVLPDHKGRFSGVVSLENNGGFASVRAGVAPGTFSGFRGVRVRVRGDGKTYSFRLRARGPVRPLSYRAKFDTTAGTWEEIDLAFTGFVPTRRGKVFAEAGPIDPASIVDVGLLIADKQAGPFSLIVDWIQAW